MPAARHPLLQLQPSDNYKGNQNTAIDQQSFHVTFFDSNLEYKQKVFNYITSKFKGISRSLLNNYKCAQANVFLKPTGSGFVYPHQNLTITDEAKYTSLSFWLPLQDTDYENGTVCLVPGSQNDFVKYRNTHIYWPYVNYFKEGAGLKYFTPINIKAGELLIIDDRIIHYTPINRSGSDRWVIHAVWTPDEAPVWFCDPKNDEVKIYEVVDNFWQFHLPGTFPEQEASKIIINDEVIYTETELTEKLEALKIGVSS